MQSVLTGRLRSLFEEGFPFLFFLFCKFIREVFMSLIEVNDDNFEVEVVNSDVPVLVDFWAPWCQPCKQLIPVMEQLAEYYQGKAKVVKINIDESQKVARRFGIRGIPNVFLFNNGESTLSFMGVNPKSIYENVIDSALKDGGEPELGELLLDEEFRAGFILTSKLDELKVAVKNYPEIVIKPFADEMSPISAVLRRSIGERVEVLLMAKPELTFIEHAALGHLDKVNELIATTAIDIEQQQVDGATALWLAARHKQVEVCRLLLEKGANPNQSAGKNPLSVVALAGSLGNVDLLKLLLDNNGDINAKGGSGESLLHMAVTSSMGRGNVNEAVIALLLNYGLTKDVLNAEGHTPLQAAQGMYDRLSERKDADEAQKQSLVSTLKNLQELLS